MIEKMEETRAKNKVYAAVLTDLSKVFDCVKHEIFIQKLHYSGFNFKSMRVTNASLSNRFKKQKLHFSIVKFSPLYLESLKTQH